MLVGFTPLQQQFTGMIGQFEIPAEVYAESIEEQGLDPEMLDPIVS